MMDGVWAVVVTDLGDFPGWNLFCRILWWLKSCLYYRSAELKEKYAEKNIVVKIAGFDSKLVTKIAIIL